MNAQERLQRLAVAVKNAQGELAMACTRAICCPLDTATGNKEAILREHVERAAAELTEALRANATMSCVPLARSL